jgi:nucleoid DNA-binding protein
MKMRDPMSPKAPLPEDDENSPNITKRKLVVAITQELADELAVQAADAQKRGVPFDEKPLSQQQVLAVMQKTLDHVSKAMAEHQKVELRNFGVFEVKVRRARVGRNPNRPEVDVPIPQRAVVKFKAGKEMREAVLRIPADLIQRLKAEKKARRQRVVKEKK